MSSPVAPDNGNKKPLASIQVAIVITHSLTTSHSFGRAAQSVCMLLPAVLWFSCTTKPYAARVTWLLTELYITPLLLAMVTPIAFCGANRLL